MTLTIFLLLKYHYSIVSTEVYKKMHFFQQNNNKLRMITFFIML
jgi:hypothetical protein